MANIMITGGCGFIGSYLAELYISAGHNVLVVDNLSSGHLDNVMSISSHPNFRFIEADVRSWGDWVDSVKWCDIIIHLAAIVGIYKVLEDPTSVLDSNITGCKNLFEAIISAGNRPRVLIASSSMVYGASVNQQQSESDPLIMQSTAEGHWIYALTKIINESTAFAFNAQHKIPATIMRIFNVIGPRQTGRYGMVVPRFIKQACTGSDITVFGSGEQTRSFCDVRDIVKIMSQLVNDDGSIGEIVNVGSEQEISINELAFYIKQLANSASSIQKISYSDAYGQNFTDIMSRRPNLSKLQSLISLQYDWTLEKSLLNMIASFRGNT